MVVCHCKAINDRVIRQLIAGGTETAAAITEHCGAGSDCGGCTDTIQFLLDERLEVASAV
ncbi:MAG: (2Fe-2S)-binding protein [Actinomycetota bacterium]